MIINLLVFYPLTFAGANPEYVFGLKSIFLGISDPGALKTIFANYLKS